MRALARGLAVGLLLAVAAFFADGFAIGRIFRAVAVAGSEPYPLVPPLTVLFAPMSLLALAVGGGCARLDARAPATRSFAAALVVAIARGALTAVVIVAFALATQLWFGEQPAEILRVTATNLGCGTGIAAAAAVLVEALAARSAPSRARDAVAVAALVVVVPVALWLGMLQVAYVREMIERGSISAAFAEVPANARRWLSAARFTIWLLAQQSLVLIAVSAARLRLERPLARVAASGLAGCAIVVALSGGAAYRELGLEVFGAFPSVQVSVMLALSGAAVAELVDRAIGARVASRFDPPAPEPDAPAASAS